MSGPPPKPDGQRQRRNERPGVNLTIPGPADASVVGSIAPAAPEGLSAPSLTAWAGFWASPLASAVDQVTDLPALTRLYRIYDDTAKYAKLFEAQPLVVGSTGQPVLHPYAKHLDALKAEARNLEDRFGLNPKSRLQLGIQMTEAVKRMNESATANLTPQWTDDDSDDAAADTRAG